MFTIIQVIALALIGSTVIKGVRNKDTEIIVIGVGIGFATIALLASKVINTFEWAGGYVLMVIALFLLASTLAFILINISLYTYKLIKSSFIKAGIESAAIALIILLFLITLIYNSLAVDVLIGG